MIKPLFRPFLWNDFSWALVLFVFIPCLWLVRTPVVLARDAIEVAQEAVEMWLNREYYRKETSGTGDKT